MRLNIVCIAAAALLRAVCVWATRDDPVFRVPYLDSAFYHYWARALAEGQGDFHGPYFLGPLYPHVLSWLYRIAGADPAVARWFQSFLGVLDVALVMALARHLAGRTAAVAAAALFALHGCFVFTEGLVVLEPLQTTLLLGAAAALVLSAPGAGQRAGRGHPRAGAAGAIGAGVLLGLATLARPSVLLLVPVLALVKGPLRWRRLACCLVAWLVVLVPTVWRNHRLGGGFVVTTNAGVNFAAGNFQGAKGRFRQPPGVQFFTSPEVLPEAAALPTAVAPRLLTVEAVAGTREAADSRLWLARTGEWIRAHPVAFVAVVLRRAGLTLQGRDIAQIESFAFHRDRLAVLRLFFVDLTWILPLAGLGVWQLRRARAPGTGLVLAFAVGALLPCVLFFVTGRHRLPAVPFLAVLAGAGVMTLVQWANARRWSRFAVTVLFLAVGAAATRVGAQPPRTAPGWESAQMAERLYALGNLDAAIRWQRAALVVLPQRSEVGLNLALYLSERGQPTDLQEAETLLRALVQRAPQQVPLLNALGTILAGRGDVAGARAVWSRALQLDPGNTPAREHLRALGP